MTVFSGLALKDVLEDSVIVPFMDKTGVTIRRVYEPTTVLRDLVRQGERPDVIIGVTGALQEMAADGDVQPDSVLNLVRSEVGVAASAGTQVAALVTTADFRDLLHRVATVAYSAAGASGTLFQRVLADLNLTDLVNGKAVVLAKGFTAEAVRDGLAEIAIQQISELAAVSGVDIVGPLPKELLAFVELSTAIGAQSGNPELASQFVGHLRSGRYIPVYQRAYLEPLFPA